LIAESLLEYETLDGNQVEEIIRTGKLTPTPAESKTGPPTGAKAATPLPEIPKPLPPKLPPGLTSPAPAPI
jgi:cell division protease FtsH